MSAPRPVGRLRKRAEFLTVAKGESAARPGVVVQMRLRAGEADMRAGFTATRKIGGAVARNRAKRRLREAARALLPRLGAPGADYVFIARAETALRPWARLLDDVESALIRLSAASPSAAPRRARSRAPRPE